MLGQDDHASALSSPVSGVAGATTFGGPARFQRHHIGTGGAHRQCGADTGHHVGSIQMAVQQQYLDQCAGACRVTVGLAGGGPPRVVLGGEHFGRAGLNERGGPGQRPGFARQDLQIVVQVQDFGALADRALMPRHHRGAVIDSDVRGR